MRLVQNRGDDAGFERVVNLPTRGIGDKTVDTLRQIAREQNLSLWQAAMHAVSQNILSARAGAAVQRFLNLVDTLASETQEVELHEQTNTSFIIVVCTLISKKKKVKKRKCD